MHSNQRGSLMFKAIKPRVIPMRASDIGDELKTVVNNWNSAYKRICWNVY